MSNKTLFISLVLSLFLTACASTESMQEPIEPLSSSQVCCSDFSQFPWIELNTAEEIDFQLDADSPIGHFSDGNSYFNAFKLSDRSRKVKIRLSSFMNDSSVVAPTLITLNEQFEIVSRTNFDQFDVKTSSAFTRTQFQLDLELDHAKTPYFIVYSSDVDLGQSIKIKHPARVRAEELGEARPMVTDPVYTYQRFGQLQLTIRTLSLQANRAPVKRVQAPQVAKAAVEVIAKPAQPETQHFYKKAIIDAVNSDDIGKALSLLDEAKVLGIKDAQTVFIEALKKHKGQ